MSENEKQESEIVKSARKALNRAAEEAKNSQLSESDRQARLERIGQGMLESIKKLPPVH